MHAGCYHLQMNWMGLRKVMQIVDYVGVKSRSGLKPNTLYNCNNQDMEKSDKIVLPVIIPWLLSWEIPETRKNEKILLSPSHFLELFTQL